MSERFELETPCCCCQFWYAVNENEGYCHINPPTISSDGFTGIWPKTQRGDWCARALEIKEEDE